MRGFAGGCIEMIIVGLVIYGLLLVTVSVLPSRTQINKFVDHMYSETEKEKCP